MVACDDHLPPLKAEPICKSPKSPRFIPGLRFRQAFVSLLALLFGLLLLLRHPAFESAAWSLDPAVSLVISDIDNTAASNLSHSLSTAVQHHDNNTYCNLARGKWVPDSSRRPLYSGKLCKPWLSTNWYCRRHKNRDLSYEQYRWQPHGCDLPAFDASQFLRRMTNQTIAFLGDSLGRQQFQSLICMLTSSSSIRRPSVISHHYGLTRGSAAYSFPSSNTTVLFYWSSTLADEVPQHDGSVQLHLDRVPQFLTKYISGFNLVIINTGHHWNRGKMKLNHWIPHIDGKQVEGRMSMGQYRHKTLDNCAKWLSLQSEQRSGDLQVMVRSLSPRHFTGGDWNSGGRCDNFGGIQEQQPEYRLDRDVESAARERVNLRVLDVGYMSRMRGEAHIGGIDGDRQDCLHWCLPGVPDYWNELMFGLLVESDSRQQTSL